MNSNQNSQNQRTQNYSRNFNSQRTFNPSRTSNLSKTFNSNQNRLNSNPNQFNSNQNRFNSQNNSFQKKNWKKRNQTNLIAAANTESILKMKGKVFDKLVDIVVDTGLSLKIK